MSPDERNDEARGEEDPTWVDPDATAALSGGPRPPAAATGLVPGQRFGPYRLVRCLGTGGFAEVWQVERADDGRVLALKVLRGIGEIDAEAVQRFEREGRLAASLSHPRAVYIVSAEVIEGRPAITMELMPGGTFQDRVNREGALAEVEAVDLVLDILDGLEAAHRLGIVHRDIKPSNCFLGADGRGRIGDFGISRSLQIEAKLTATGSFIGTPAFAAPEQIRGRPADERTDLYAVGALLYTLLAGRAPFEAAGGELLARVVADPPPPLSRQGVRVSRGLRSIVSRTLAKDPTRRPASCAELRRLLLPFSSRAVSAGRPLARTAAFMIDATILFLLMVPVAVFVSGRGLVEVLRSRESIPHDAVLKLLDLALDITYFTVLEALWGRTPGKAALRLRVRRLDGSPARVPALLVRNASFFIPALILQQIADPFLVSPSADEFVALLGIGLIWSTMRPTNGWAGLHELLSRTRVVRTRLPGNVPAGARRSAASAPVSGGEQRGPYRLGRTLWAEEQRSLSSAHDPALGRDVWIYQGGLGDSVYPERAARLRWLRGGVEAGQRWDAFEAPSGEPLLHLVERMGAADLDRVQRWLLQFAEEIATSLRTDELPDGFSLRRIWIDEDDRIRLLPFPPNASAGEENLRPAGSWPAFLHEFAHCALAGHSKVKGAALDVPDHASRFLESLQHAMADEPTASRIVEEIRGFLGRPTSVVVRSQRLRHLVYTYGLPWTFGFFLFMVLAPTEGWKALNVVTPPLLPFAALAILSAFAVPGGAAMYLFGMTLQDRQGRRASRLRSGWRAIVAWSPLLVQVVVGGGAKGMVKTGGIAGPLLVILFTAGVVAVIHKPARGWQDRVAGIVLS